jgi:D-alanyl-D-alanine carboxypeptidase
MKKILMSKEFISAVVIIIIIVAVLISREFLNNTNVKELKNSLDNLTLELSEKENVINILTEEKEKLEKELGTTIEELEDKEKEVDKLSDKTNEIIKLISTDEELLQKYSKVFFLNENYAPKELKAIDQKWWAISDKIIDVNSDIKKHLENLLEDAQEDGIELRVLSGYRSFSTQASLKYNYLITYGSGANTFSADQGYSEHQLGTTVDFTTPTLGANLSTSFDQTEAFKWLTENAYKYGFVMSYPKGNQFYQYEPWHWRFVSRDLADELHDEGIGFYDMDQREINKYLQDFFD